MLSFLKRKNKLDLYAPLSGEVIALEKVPDPVFAEKMVGDGVAIIPSAYQVVAPCDGTVTQIFSTCHALTMEVGEGIDLLLHIGIDTVELKGEGFKVLVEAGTKVKQGQALLEVDLETLRQKGKQLHTPLLVTNMEKVMIKESYEGVAIAGQTKIMTLMMQE